MSNAPVIYADFSVKDFRGSESLSSYALSATPFIFIPDYPRDDLRVLWSFGDGTTSTSITATKHYEFPGQYTTNLAILDCYNNVLLSSEKKELKVYDYIPFSITLQYLDYYIYLQPDGESFYFSSDMELYGSCNNDVFDFQNSTVSDPILVNAYFPPYQPVSDVYVDVVSSGSVSYWDVEENNYNHLDNTYTFLDLIYNNSISAFQYNEISKITPTTNKIFAKIEDGEIVPSGEHDLGSFFVGLSGNKEIFYRDDAVNERLLMNFHFDKNNNHIPDRVDYLNNLSLTLSCSVSPNLSATHLNITTNGLDGGSSPIQSFNFPEYIFNYQSLPFVVNVKDSSGFSPKNFPKIEIEDVTFSLLSSGEPIDTYYYTISSLNDTLSAQSHKGSFRGLISFRNFSGDVSNVSLSSVISIDDDQLNSYVLSGLSTEFSLYENNKYNFYKNNEDFDFTSTLKDLRFQEFLLDDDVTFDEFFGSVYGGLSSSHESLGKKIYEKISNFLDNIQNVDRSEIVSLISQMDMVGNSRNIYNSNLSNPPENIRRILDMASISKNKIRGSENQFSQNFDIRGHTSKDVFGINLGDEINTSTYVISAGRDIVALEKFSGIYTQLNTYQPLSVLSASNYMLSSLSQDWGWPLVLPSDIYNNFSLDELSKYYTFFEYGVKIDVTRTYLSPSGGQYLSPSGGLYTFPQLDYLDHIDGTLYSNNIDFSNPLTTISRDDNLYDSFEIMLTDILTQKLG